MDYKKAETITELSNKARAMKDLSASFTLAEVVSVLHKELLDLKLRVYKLENTKGEVR